MTPGLQSTILVDEPQGALSGFVVGRQQELQFVGPPPQRPFDDTSSPAVWRCIGNSSRQRRSNRVSPTRPHLRSLLQRQVRGERECTWLLEPGLCVAKRTELPGAIILEPKFSNGEHALPQEDTDPPPHPVQNAVPFALVATDMSPISVATGRSPPTSTRRLRIRFGNSDVSINRPASSVAMSSSSSRRCISPRA